MDSFQNTTSGLAQLKNSYDDGSGQSPLAEALKQRRLKKANNHRLTDTNSADDMKSMDTEDDTNQ